MARKKRNRKNNHQNSKKVNETKVVKLENPNIIIPKEIQDQLNEVVIDRQPPMNKELLTEETDEVEKEQKLWKEYDKWKSLAHCDWTSYEKKPLTRIRIPGDHIVWPDLKENKLEKEETEVEQENEEQQDEVVESEETEVEKSDENEVVESEETEVEESDENEVDESDETEVEKSDENEVVESEENEVEESEETEIEQNEHETTEVVESDETEVVEYEETEVEQENEVEESDENEVDESDEIKVKQETEVVEDEETEVVEDEETEVEQEDEIEQQFEVIESTQTLKNVFQNLKLMHIFCVVNEKEEQARYVKLKKTLTEHELDKYYTCIAPTWKNTITDENVKKYIKSTEFLPKYRKKINLPPKRMSRAELSVILNHRAVLRHISKKYNNGYFLILESDVEFTENFNMFPEILKQLNENEDRWDLMYIGKMPQSNFYKSTTELVNTDKYQIYTGKEDKTADAMIWKYDTIVKFLKYMKSDLDFKLPYDTYIQNFYRNENINFGWVQPHLVFQTTFHGISKSNVQGDKEIESRKPDFYF